MKKKIMIIGVLVALVLTAVLLRRTGNNGESGVLAISGNVEVTETDLGFKAAGRVTELLSDEGDRVVKGEKIAMLDNAEYQAVVSQNRANRMNAEAALAKAMKDYDRAQMLSAQEAISHQQMDAATTAVDMARAQFEQAGAALRTTEVRLRDTVLYAPSDGLVLRKNVEAGETVGAGVPVLTIGDMQSPWVKVYVQERMLGLVRIGQHAEVRTDSYPRKVYQGTVTTISSEAEFTPKNVQTQEERVKLVFGVKVQVKNENGELKPGMPADVRILLK
jgi:HlyD family secretion protein